MLPSQPGQHDVLHVESLEAACESAMDPTDIIKSGRDETRETSQWTLFAALLSLCFLWLKPSVRSPMP